MSAKDCLNFLAFEESFFTLAVALDNLAWNFSILPAVSTKVSCCV